MGGKINLRILLVVWIFLLTAGSAVSTGRIIYVDDDGPADFKTIQAAIDDANDGDVVIIATGTYTGDGNRDIDFKGKAITVRSTDPNDPNIVAATIIDCNHLGRGFYFHSGEDANATLDGLAVINGQAQIGAGIYCENQSGPTIANCVIKWNTANGEESDGFGGGISGCNGKIINCIITENWALGAFHGSGGGLYRCNGTISNCTISRNEVGPSGLGGGLSECNGDIINCTIRENWVAEDHGGSVGHGGGLYRCNGAIINSTISGNVILSEDEAFGGGLYDCNGTIINCTISGNGAACGGEYSEYSAGGGLYDCDGTIINCTINWNMAGTGTGYAAEGGGLYACDGTIINCTIIGNIVEGGWGQEGEGSMGLGGGLCGCHGKIINCIISDNTATVIGESYNSFSAGGGIHWCKGTITNCTIIRNVAADAGWFGQSGAGGGLDWCIGTITNCTIWANTADVGSQLHSSSDPSYSCVQDWIVVGTSNINTDPCFADVNNGDYHLKSQAGRWNPNSASWVKDDVTSLCIDAGDPSRPIGLEPFPNGGIINMGAYGGTAEASKSYFGEQVCETIVAGDLNGDCVVNLIDLSLMAIHWLEEH